MGYDIDILIAFLTGLRAIRDVLEFPTLKSMK